MAGWLQHQRLGEVFVEYGARLDGVYTTYVNQYNKCTSFLFWFYFCSRLYCYLSAVAVMTEGRLREPFRNLINEVREKQARRSLALPDLLIMPIQRVPRYFIFGFVFLVFTHSPHKGTRSCSMS